MDETHRENIWDGGWGCLFIYGQLPSRTGDLFVIFVPTEKNSDFCSSTKEEHRHECVFEPHNVLLDLITEHRARHQEYHRFSSVRLEGTSFRKK